MKLKLILFLLFFSSVAQAKTKIYMLDLIGPINPIRADFIEQSFKKINDTGTKTGLVIINIDTPGGHETAMRRIIQSILSSRLPVAVFVNPSGARAASAGFFILLSADIAVMAPGTNAGAAHPVFAIGGLFPIKKESIGKTMIEKVTNDSLAFLRSFSEKRGKNIDMAVKAVTENKSFTANEAFKNNLIDYVAKDVNDLVELLNNEEITRINGDSIILNLTGASFEKIEQDPRTAFLLFLGSPMLALLLGLSGILLVWFEIKNPGMIAPGVIGGICIVLALVGFSFLPINIVGVILIIGGIGLIITEAVMPGFGAFGIGGIIALFVGSIVLVKSPIPEMRIAYIDALALVIPFAILIIILGRLALKAHRKQVKTGKEGLIHQHGKTVTKLDPKGSIFIHGEYWDAISESGEAIEPDTIVTVNKITDLTLTVTPKNQE